MQVPRCSQPQVPRCSRATTSPTHSRRPIGNRPTDLARAVGVAGLRADLEANVRVLVAPHGKPVPEEQLRVALAAVVDKDLVAGTRRSARQCKGLLTAAAACGRRTGSVHKQAGGVRYAIKQEHDERKESRRRKAHVFRQARRTPSGPNSKCDRAEGE